MSTLTSLFIKFISFFTSPTPKEDTHHSSILAAINKKVVPTSPTHCAPTPATSAQDHLPFSSDVKIVQYSSDSWPSENPVTFPTYDAEGNINPGCLQHNVVNVFTHKILKVYAPAPWCSRSTPSTPGNEVITQLSSSQGAEPVVYFDKSSGVFCSPWGGFTTTTPFPTPPKDVTSIYSHRTFSPGATISYSADAFEPPLRTWKDDGYPSARCTETTWINYKGEDTGGYLPAPWCEHTTISVIEWNKDPAADHEAVEKYYKYIKTSPINLIQEAFEKGLVPTTISPDQLVTGIFLKVTPPSVKYPVSLLIRATKTLDATTISSIITTLSDIVG